MTQRTRTTLPSTRALTRKATSGGKKSVSFDSVPRIHHGLAAAAPLSSASADNIIKARVILMHPLYNNQAAAARTDVAQLKCCVTAKTYTATPLNPRDLPLLLAATSGEC